MIRLLFVVLLLQPAHLLLAQQTGTPTGTPTGVPKVLFADEAPLSCTLVARMQAINRDRAKPKTEQVAQKFPAQFSYAPSPADTVRLPVTLSVRGNFRRDGANCKFPPLYLNVPKKAAKHTLFAGQNKLKLVTHCQLDEYVVREYLVYRLYNLLTDLSFRARLTRVTYADSLRKKPTETHWGLLLEDADDLAKRNHAKLTKLRTKAQFADSLTMATAAVFEFMIGNTDWSVPFQHNFRILIDSTKARPLVVPYDFDHAGIVDARYARPAGQLGIESVRERLYRGPTYPASLLNRVFEQFVTLKPQFYALYQTNPHLSKEYIRDTVQYLDEFYRTISDPKEAKRAFGLNTGVGIQIRGLN